jgi:hypothetical protein
VTDTTEVQNPYSFGTLKEQFLQMIGRGGDNPLGSDSDTQAGRFLNAAEQYLCNKLGAPWFLRHSDTITTTAGDEEITFPVNIADITDIWDEANIQKLQYVPRGQWNSYIVKPTSATGNPLAWTKWEYTRRTNQASPATEYGQRVVHVWPVSNSAFTLNYDGLLRPGAMFDDDDQPVTPYEYHFGLLNIAAMLFGPRDIAPRTFQEYVRTAMSYIADAKRENERNLSGNLRMVPREEFARKTRRYNAPLTRRGQLYGGYGW